MDKFQYRNYIVRKYNILDNTKIQNYVKLDGLICVDDNIKVSKLIKKGALNLYKNYNYMREVPTEDMKY